MIARVKADSFNLPDTDDGLKGTEYATPWLFQLKTVTLRTFRAFWRQPDYGFT